METVMETFQSLYRNPFLREYFNSTQFSVTPWVVDPNGLSHPFVFDFELKFFDKNYAHNIYAWMNQWWWLSIVYSVIYVILIYYGRSLMESRERYEARVPLILWNVGLAMFSTLGMIRCLPEMVFSLSTKGLQYTVCDRTKIYGITGYWLVKILVFLF
jgi:GNS1/SUR4 family protein